MSNCQDLIFDTHYIPEITINDTLREFIIRQCDIIWVPKYNWENEVPVRCRHLITSISSTYKTLEKMGKFKIKRVGDIRIPRNVESQLRRQGADEGDLAIVKIAFFRHRRRREVIIFSNDPHITDKSPLLRPYNIHVSTPRDYINWFGAS